MKHKPKPSLAGNSRTKYDLKWCSACNTLKRTRVVEFNDAGIAIKFRCQACSKILLLSDEL